jgi:hypothetical protein
MRTSLLLLLVIAGYSAALLDPTRTTSAALNKTDCYGC